MVKLFLKYCLYALANESSPSFYLLMSIMVTSVGGWLQGSSLTEGNRGKRSKRSGPGANGNHEPHDNPDAKPVSTHTTPTATVIY